jgi:DNA (cytosine-5)-methyltransferase 1
MKKKIKVMSLFSGVAGLEQGLSKDFEVVGFSEISRSASKILKKHFPSVPNFGDIKKIQSGDLPSFDMLIGGSPCQNLSTAGTRTGLKGKKSSLFYDYLRILKERKPDHFIWENVKGTLSSNKGKDFLEVLKLFTDQGYNLQWQVLNACDFGLAQSRSRIFVFGSRKINELPGLIDIARENDYKTKKLSLKKYCGTLIKDGLVNTITKSYGVGSGDSTKLCSFDPTKENLEKLALGEIEGEIRLLTPLECERLMGWPDGYTRVGLNNKGLTEIMSKRSRYNACGNGIVPQCVEALLVGFQEKKLFQVLDKKKYAFKVKSLGKILSVFNLSELSKLDDIERVKFQNKGIISSAGVLLFQEKQRKHISTYGSVLVSSLTQEKIEVLTNEKVKYLLERAS